VQLSTLAKWIAAGFSSEDQNQNPKFVKSNYGDYRINNTLLFKAGANAGVSTDIVGVRRIPGSPDIGAFENPFNLIFDSVNIVKPKICSGGADSIKFRINNTSPCVFRNLQLGVSINGFFFVV